MSSLCVDSGSGKMVEYDCCDNKAALSMGRLRVESSRGVVGR